MTKDELTALCGSEPKVQSYIDNRGRIWRPHLFLYDDGGQEYEIAVWALDAKDARRRLRLAARTGSVGLLVSETEV